MSAWVELASHWFEQNEVLIAWLTLSSLVVFIGSLVFIPWVTLQLPSDYFVRPHRDYFNPLGEHPVAIFIVNVLRNILGIVFILIGLVLLVLPGQGLLTIIIGLFITRFPGKRRLTHWLVRRRQVIKTINWIRKKAHKAPMKV